MHRSGRNNDAMANRYAAFLCAECDIHGPAQRNHNLVKFVCVGILDERVGADRKTAIIPNAGACHRWNPFCKCPSGCACSHVKRSNCISHRSQVFRPAIASRHSGRQLCRQHDCNLCYFLHPLSPTITSLPIYSQRVGESSSSALRMRSWLTSEPATLRIMMSFTLPGNHCAIWL